ncbi:SRPBCC family protein [Streptomyces sp. NPDC047017]|uniref:SRPBCC family protein n=1 Tax=Streptomyces sp. NPDC047017 TaxID=3155024 RepID=UPI0033D8E251
MAGLTLHAVGPARPEAVWERYACLDQWASWSPQIRAVHADLRHLAPGLGGAVESVAGLRAAFRVGAVDQDRRYWTWRVRLGPLRVTLRHDVRAHPRGSRAGLTLRGPLPVLVAYAPLARLALRRLVRP